MTNANAETVKLGVQDAIQRTNFEKELRDAIARRKSKGKAPVVANIKVEKFIAQCVKLRSEPGWKMAGAILGRIMADGLYLLSDGDRDQFSARLASQPEEQAGEHSADARAGTQAESAATAEASDSPAAVQNEQRSEPGALALTVSETVFTISEVPTRLSQAERKQLKKCEKFIATGRDAAVEANDALRQIRDQKLYREDFKTFEEYCFKTWSLRRSTAYQRITWAQAQEILSAMADKSVEVNERQARALGGLSDENMVRVWKHAAKASDTPNPTNKDIKAARKELNLAPMKSGAGKHNSKSSSEADQVTTPASSQAEFGPHSRWLTFRDQLDHEYGGWPLAHRVAFRANLRAWLKEQEDGAITGGRLKSTRNALSKSDLYASTSLGCGESPGTQRPMKTGYGRSSANGAEGGIWRCTRIESSPPKTWSAHLTRRINSWSLSGRKSSNLTNSKSHCLKPPAISSPASTTCWKNCNSGLTGISICRRHARRSARATRASVHGS